jgi:hypothetical protein
MCRIANAQFTTFVIEHKQQFVRQHPAIRKCCVRTHTGSSGLELGPWITIKRVRTLVCAFLNDFHLHIIYLCTVPIVGGPLMSTKRAAVEARRTAIELRKLPPQERDAILAAAAKRAEQDYRTKQQLTDFEAFAKDDLHDTSIGAP